MKIFNPNDVVIRVLPTLDNIIKDKVYYFVTL